jgi:hypothetical protein
MSDFILFWIVVSFLSILWKKHKIFFFKYVFQQKFTTCQIKKLKIEKTLHQFCFLVHFFSFCKFFEILLENILLAPPPKKNPVFFFSN